MEKIIGRAYNKLWNNAPTPLLGIKNGQIERYSKEKCKNTDNHLGKEEKIPFSEFSSLTGPWRSVVEDAGESMTRGGFTNGLSQCSVNNFRELQFFFFCLFHSCWSFFLLFIFLSHIFHFIHQILHCVTSKISIFHLDLTYIQKASEGN